MFKKRKEKESETQDIYRHIEGDILWGLAHAIREAEKSHDLLSTNWRPRKAGGIVPVQTWRPENQGSQWCKSWSVWGHKNLDWILHHWLPQVRSFKNQEHQCPKAGERMDVPAQVESKFTLPLPFYSIRWIGQCHPHWWRQSSLLHLPIQIKHCYTHTQKLCFTSYLGIP